MTSYDGQEVWAEVTSEKLGQTVVYKGTATPVGAANKIPQYGLFCLVDSLTTPTTRTWYIQTSATLSSPSFVEIPDNIPDIIYGDGSDGNVTISSNTDLGASNYKQYNNLTINSGFSLTGDSGMIIRVKGTLTFGDSTSVIHVNGKGAAGGPGAESGTSGDGGAGGGFIRVIAKTISGTGKIQANGSAGVASGADHSANTSGTVGTSGINNGGFQTAPTGGGPGVPISNGGGGGGGGGSIPSNGGQGGNSSSPAAGGVGQLTTPSNRLLNSYGGGGGGAGMGTSLNGGGGGGGAGVIILTSQSNIPAVVLECIGGNGAAGGGTNRGGGGGAGGLILVYRNGTDSSTKTVTGGVKGGSTIATDGTVGTSVSIIY